MRDLYVEGKSPLQPSALSPFDPTRVVTILLNKSESTHCLLCTMLRFIDEHVGDPLLGPARAANEFHISKRYVHKVFASAGMTFRTYLTARRLDGACKDLISAESPRHQISLIALHWGFRDISTFNRTFKRRFGCTPRALRVRCVWPHLLAHSLRDHRLGEDPI